jgi:hypothetical protein
MFSLYHRGGKQCKRLVVEKELFVSEEPLSGGKFVLESSTSMKGEAPGYFLESQVNLADG